MEETISVNEALRVFFMRHLANINNWSVNIKGLTIVHRALRNAQINETIVKTLKEEYESHILAYCNKKQNKKYKQ